MTLPLIKMKRNNAARVKNNTAFLRRAFTFIEVMAAVAVLALGVVFIYEAFFVMLDAFSGCRDYLTLGFWAEERLWAARDSLCRSGPLGLGHQQGFLRQAGRDVKWHLSYHLISTGPDLYRVSLDLDWRGRKKQEELARAAYVIYEKR